MNGQTVTEPGVQVNVGLDTVTVDGNVIEVTVKLVYIMLHKPAGYVVTVKDPQSRPTVYDIMNGISQRIFPVGRLDLNVEGLLLFTNDGSLSHRLIHPRYEIEKVYTVLVRGKPDGEALRAIESGIQLEDGLTAPTEVNILDNQEVGTLLEMKMHEGRKRQIKRMWSAVGHPVVKLRRISFAGLSLDDLRPGEWRFLSDEEVMQLKMKVGVF